MKFQSKRHLLHLLVVLTLISLITLPGLSKLAVAPLSIKLGVASGDSGTSDLVVHNTGNEEITVDIELLDWWRTPEGNLKFLQPGTRDRSCAEWLLYSPTSLTLKPGDRKNVSVEIDVPKDAKGDHWAMLLVSEKLKPPEGENPVTMRVRMNYAIKILQQAPNPKNTQAEITNIELQKSDPLELAITYANTGTAHLQTTGRVEIRNLEGDTVKTFEVDKFPTLPGEKHIITIKEQKERESLSPGQYYAIAVLDFGGDHLIQGGLPIEIPEEKENSKE